MRASALIVNLPVFRLPLFEEEEKMNVDDELYLAKRKKRMKMK